MKASVLLLVASLAANAVLAAVVFMQRNAASGGATREVGTGGPLVRNGAATDAQAARPNPTPASEASRPLAEWHEEDFRRLADRLRVSGVSEQVIREVVARVVGQHFEARRRALGLDYGRGGKLRSRHALKLRAPRRSSDRRARSAALSRAR